MVKFSDFWFYMSYFYWNIYCKSGMIYEKSEIMIKNLKLIYTDGVFTWFKGLFWMRRTPGSAARRCGRSQASGGSIVRQSETRVSVVWTMVGGGPYWASWASHWLNNFFLHMIFVWFMWVILLKITDCVRLWILYHFTGDDLNVSSSSLKKV